MKKNIQIFSILAFVILYCFNNQTFSQVNSNNVTDTDSSLFMVVENPPSFPGGDKARMDFLVKNLVYPKHAREVGIEGTVFITFVIEEDGSVSNIKILRGIGGGCDEEAVRVTKLMPKWIPAKQRGKNVRVQYNLPYKFTLSNKNKIKENKKGR